MKIILLLNSLSTGGAEFSSLQLYGWLKSRGHSVSIVCYKKASPAFNTKEFGLDEVIYLPGNSFWFKLKRFNEFMNEMQPDLVHSVLFESNLLVRSIRFFNWSFIHLESLVNEMYSSNRYSDPQVTPLKLSVYRFLDFSTQWLVDCFHANGASVAAHYQAKLGISPKRIRIILRGRMPNVFINNVDASKSKRAEIGIGEELVLINVARHEFQKAQDILIQALDYLGPLKPKVKLILVGREGKLTLTVNELIRSLGLENNVIILGHREDVASLLAASDIFVFPSRFEGLPGALIEAEAAGLPIVCSDIANNREVANELVNALFFPLDNAKLLADRIKVLIEDESLRKEMGFNSLKQFEAKFSLEESHSRMESLMDELVKNRR